MPLENILGITDVVEFVCTEESISKLKAIGVAYTRINNILLQ